MKKKKKNVKHKRCTIGSKTPELEVETATKKEFYSHLTLSRLACVADALYKGFRRLRGPAATQAISRSDSFSFCKVSLNRSLPCSSTHNCLRPPIQCLNKRTAVEKAVQPHTFVFCKEKKTQSMTILALHNESTVVES